MRERDGENGYRERESESGERQRLNERVGAREWLREWLREWEKELVWPYWTASVPPSPRDRPLRAPDAMLFSSFGWGGERSDGIVGTRPGPPRRGRPPPPPVPCGQPVRAPPPLPKPTRHTGQSCIGRPGTKSRAYRSCAGRVPESGALVE